MLSCLITAELGLGVDEQYVVLVCLYHVTSGQSSLAFGRYVLRYFQAEEESH